VLCGSDRILPPWSLSASSWSSARCCAGRTDVWVAKSGLPSCEPIEDHVVAGQRCILMSRKVWEQVLPVAKAKRRQGAKAKRRQGYDEVPRVRRVSPWLIGP
jgi:hypothetical protein